MEKEKQLDLLTAIADEFGLSAGEVVAYWVKNGRLASDEVALSEETETAENILPGMYVYADNTFGSEIFPEPQIKAVVGYVEENTVYAVCLREEALRWSSDGLNVPMFRGWKDGQYATRKILEACRRSGKPAEAAQWCYDYDYDGVKEGEAFLPSAAELRQIFLNKNAINESLRALDCPVLDDEYASSIEESNNFILAYGMGEDEEDIGCTSCGKLDKLAVRPVLKIQF